MFKSICTGKNGLHKCAYKSLKGPSSCNKYTVAHVNNLFLPENVIKYKVEMYAHAQNITNKDRIINKNASLCQIA